MEVNVGSLGFFILFFFVDENSHASEGGPSCLTPRAQMFCELVAALHVNNPEGIKPRGGEGNIMCLFVVVVFDSFSTEVFSENVLAGRENVLNSIMSDQQQQSHYTRTCL